MKTVLSLVWCLAFVVTAYTQPIKISIDKSDYLIGEPVYMKLRSEASVPLFFESYLISLRIKYPDGTLTEYKPPVHADVFPQPERAGTSPSLYKVEYSTLIISKGKLLFDMDGQYELTVTTPDSGKIPLSNVVTLTISKPTNPGDLQAYRLIQGNPWEYGVFIYMEAGEQFRQGYSIVQKLASMPSRYREVSKFVMSTNYSESYYDFADTVFRAVDLGRAIEFAQCKNANVPAYVRISNALKLKHALIQARTIGQSTQAAESAVQSQFDAVMSEFSSEDAGVYDRLRQMAIK